MMEIWGTAAFNNFEGLDALTIGQREVEEDQVGRFLQQYLPPPAASGHGTVHG